MHFIAHICPLLFLRYIRACVHMRCERVYILRVNCIYHIAYARTCGAKGCIRVWCEHVTHARANDFRTAQVFNLSPTFFSHMRARRAQGHIDESAAATRVSLCVCAQ